MKQLNKLKQLSNQERNNKLVELQHELMQARAQIATGAPPKSPGRVKTIRRTIAAIYTLNNLPVKVEEKTAEKEDKKNVKPSKEIKK